MEKVTDLLLIFILLQCPCYMKADCSAITYNVFPRGYNIFMQTKVEPFFKPRKLTDRTKCVQFCLEETFCHIWRFDNGTCHLFHSMKDKLRVEKVQIPSSTTYYKTEQDETWFKIYFLKSGSGFLAAESFLGTGTYESWGPLKCTSILCSDLFRSNLIDVWSNLPIHKVKLLARENNKNVVRILFDGEDSTKEDWFSMSRVLESLWVNFQNGTRANIFSIATNNRRNFYISSYHSGCSGDCGWLYVIANNPYCKYEKGKLLPQILYSGTNTSTIWARECGKAEDFSIFVSFK